MEMEAMKNEQATVETNESATIPVVNSTPKKRGRKPSGKVKPKVVSKMAASEKIKQSLMDDMMTFLKDKYGECLKVIPYDDSTSAKNYALASPVTDSEGNVSWIKVDVSIPRGNRTSHGYDGYDMAEKYKMNVTGVAESTPLPY